jgi:ABC-type multidrug transport system ATPase subunit
MRIFATLMKPTDGWFEIMGKDCRRHYEEARRYLFFIGHGSFLYDDLTVIENIQFAMGLRGWSPTLNEIRMTLDRVGIGPYGAQKSRYLSAGMQKRLVLAKALLARPNLLLLDEPYASLDEKGVLLMNQCIQDFLKRGAAIFMSGHDRDRAADVATRAGLLHNKVLQEIPLSELDRALF